MILRPQHARFKNWKVDSSFPQGHHSRTCTLVGMYCHTCDCVTCVSTLAESAVSYPGSGTSAVLADCCDCVLFRSGLTRCPNSRITSTCTAVAMITCALRVRCYHLRVVISATQRLCMPSAPTTGCATSTYPLSDVDSAAQKTL